MSFTSNIKNEISNVEYSNSEMMSELSAILNIGVKISSDKFEIYTENISVARRIYKLIKDIYHVNIEMDNSGVNSLRKNKLVDCRKEKRHCFYWLKDEHVKKIR